MWRFVLRHGFLQSLRRSWSPTQNPLLSLPVCHSSIKIALYVSFYRQSATGFLEMEPTIFKIAGLLTICEEFSHFSCFRQCHVNLFKNLAEIGEDENVDWFDRVKVLDSNILALINGEWEDFEVAHFKAPAGHRVTPCFFDLWTYEQSSERLLIRCHAGKR